jgi:hypothetical protein
MTMSLFYYIIILNYKFAFAGVRFTLGANLDSHRPSPTFRMVAVPDTRVFGRLRLPGFPGI